MKFLANSQTLSLLLPNLLGKQFLLLVLATFNLLHQLNLNQRSGYPPICDLKSLKIHFARSLTNRMLMRKLTGGDSRMKLWQTTKTSGSKNNDKHEKPQSAYQLLHLQFALSL